MKTSYQASLQANNTRISLNVFKKQPKLAWVSCYLLSQMALILWDYDYLFELLSEGITTTEKVAAVNCFRLKLISFDSKISAVIYYFSKVGLNYFPGFAVIFEKASMKTPKNENPLNIKNGIGLHRVSPSKLICGDTKTLVQPKLVKYDRTKFLISCGKASAHMTSNVL